jgi:hypothetical protein
MIYPRLKLKSEVFANILDGQATDFKIEGDKEGDDILEGAQEAGGDDSKRI